MADQVLDSGESSQILKQSSLSEDLLKEIVDGVSETLGGEKETIPIKAWLYFRGFNGGFFFDTDEWFVDATVVHPETKEFVEVPKLFIVKFYNAGFKFELMYRWGFIFISSDNIRIKDLHKGVYSQGLGITFAAVVGVEAAYMLGQNRPGHLIYVSPGFGFSGGVQFPKMEFRLNPEVDEFFDFL